MHDVPRAGGIAAAAVASLLATTPSCTRDTTECDCAPQGFTVTISGPPQTTQVVPSGSACVAASVTCTSSGVSGSCDAYRVVPSAEGTCQVDVIFGGGTDDEQQVNIVHSAGCCSGFYADPPSAGDVDFQAPAAAADGGVDA